MPAVTLGGERSVLLLNHPQHAEYLWSIETLGLGIVEIPGSGVDTEDDKPRASAQACLGAVEQGSLYQSPGQVLPEFVLPAAELGVGLFKLSA